MWNGLTTSSVPWPPVLLGDGGGETWAQSWAWEEGEGCGEGVFKIWLYLSLSYADSIGKLAVVLLFKLIFFPLAKACLSFVQRREWALLAVRLDPHTFVVFSCPILPEVSRSEREAAWLLCCQMGGRKPRHRPIFKDVFKPLTHQQVGYCCKGKRCYQSKAGMVTGDLLEKLCLYMVNP